jgi:transposase
MGRTYDLDLREYLVKMVVEEGKKRTEVSREMEVPLGTLTRWVTEYKKKQHAEQTGVEYLTPSEQNQRDKEFENRIRDLQEENEILKKAMHIFAKNPK